MKKQLIKSLNKMAKREKLKASIRRGIGSAAIKVQKAVPFYKNIDKYGSAALSYRINKRASRKK